MSNLYLEGISILELETLIKKTVEDVLLLVAQKDFPSISYHNCKTSCELITRQQTAKLLGVSLVTLHNWTKQGRLTAYRIGTRIRYKLDEVNSALTEVKSTKYQRKS